MGRLHVGTMGRLHVGTMGRLHVGTMGRLHVGTMGRLHVGTMGRLHVGTMGRLHVGACVVSSSCWSSYLWEGYLLALCVSVRLFLKLASFGTLLDREKNFLTYIYRKAVFNISISPGRKLIFTPIKQFYGDV